jgi:hypothetical protein
VDSRLALLREPGPVVLWPVARHDRADVAKPSMTAVRAAASGVLERRQRRGDLLGGLFSPPCGIAPERRRLTIVVAEQITMRCPTNRRAGSVVAALMHDHPAKAASSRDPQEKELTERLPETDLSVTKSEPTPLRTGSQVPSADTESATFWSATPTLSVFPEPAVFHRRWNTSKRTSGAPFALRLYGSRCGDDGTWTPSSTSVVHPSADFRK